MLQSTYARVLVNSVSDTRVLKLSPYDLLEIDGLLTLKDRDAVGLSASRSVGFSK